MPAPSLERLLADLARPAAYPHGAEDFEVHHTHVSVVFLAGESAYKLKKPVSLGFLDFSTRALRRAACEAEVELNRRLAPEVYLGVACVREAAAGLRVVEDCPDPTHATCEPAVWMRRLPAERTLAALLARDALEPATLVRLGERVARFHAGARGGPELERYGRLEVVGGNCRENFAQVRGLPEPFEPALVAAVEARTEAALAALGPTIEARAAAGRTRDTHGDLRLEHCYLLAGPDAPAWHRDGEPFVIVDCIEFNERFRFADPAADLAFLLMDLRAAGRADLANALEGAHLAAADDPGLGGLLPLYVAYRATVRAKVGLMLAAEAEVPARERTAGRERARAFLLLALGALAPPGERPCLVVVCGLPGTGKSTLARALSAAHGLRWIRADAVRKELAAAEGVRAAPGIDAGLYTPAWSARTYAECLARARATWRAGGRALVDATFVDGARGAAFLEAARDDGVQALVLRCEAPDEVACARLRGRRGDPSDADEAVHAHLRARARTVSGAAARVTRTLDTSGPPEATLASATASLAEAGLASPA